MVKPCPMTSLSSKRPAMSLNCRGILMVNDQAEALRHMVRNQELKGEGRSTRVITVTSGKGGVGKSNFSLNFSLALSRIGKKVLIFDADISMANIDVLMGVTSP